jgi:hypothetical protein
MSRTNRPVQTVGPTVTSTLYRRDSQDRLRIESGPREDVPNLTSQGIIIDPEEPND